MKEHIETSHCSNTNLYMLKALSELMAVVKTLTDDIYQIKSDSIIINNDMMNLVKGDIVEEVNAHVSNKFEIIDKRVDRIHQRLGEVVIPTSNTEAQVPISASKEPIDASKEKSQTKNPETSSPDAFSRSSPPYQPSVPPNSPPMTSQRRRRRSTYLAKPKVLYIGDSVAHNAEFNSIEREANIRIRTVKAYSSVFNDQAKWPKKNITDVTPSALMKTWKEDEYTHLVVAAPTVDISNLDTSKLNPTDNIEYYRQEVVVSCKNIFNVAHEALKNKSNLVKVIVMEHAPRFDEPFVDP
jgi:hypothetical protein